MPHTLRPPSAARKSANMLDAAEADVWPGHRTRDRYHGASHRTACYAP